MKGNGHNGNNGNGVVSASCAVCGATPAKFCHANTTPLCAEHESTPLLGHIVVAHGKNVRKYDVPIERLDGETAMFLMQFPSGHQDFRALENPRGGIWTHGNRQVHARILVLDKE